MLDQRSIAQFAQLLAAGVVKDAHALVAADRIDVTPDEAETILLVTLATAAALEGHAIIALPPDKAASVRAFTDRLASEIQRISASNPNTPKKEV